MNLLELFDEIQKIKKEKPDQVEAYIKTVLEHEMIRIAGGDVEKLKKLRQIQWTIDGQLRKYKDPQARLNKMVELFWKGFGEFQGAVNGFSK